LREGRDNAFIMFLKEGRKGDCGIVGNSRRSGNFREYYTRRPSRRNCESLWEKMIGKPCIEKPYVRFEVAGDGEVLW